MKTNNRNNQKSEQAYMQFLNHFYNEVDSEVLVEYSILNTAEELLINFEL